VKEWKNNTSNTTQKNSENTAVKNKRVIRAEDVVFKIQKKTQIDEPDSKDSKYKNIFALTNKQKKLVYEIRYKSYISNSSINPQSNPVFLDEYDKKDNCPSFLLHYSNLAIASIRPCIYLPEIGWTRIPGLDVFKNEIDQHIGLDKRIVESNKFVILPEYQQESRQAKFYLFKNIFNSADLIDADYIVTAVRAEHTRFYKLLFFNPISEEKKYPHLNFKTVLLACPFRAVMSSFYQDKNNPSYKVLKKFVK
jgi:hypothetical protein